MCLGNNQGNFQLHRFTRRENTAKSNKRESRDLSVVVGAHKDVDNQQSPQKRHQIRRTIVHGLYDRHTMRYDIALLQLKKSVRYNDRASPICVDGSEFPPETECVVTGWGLTSPEAGTYVVICYCHCR